jgi:hypothetical protein
MGCTVLVHNQLCTAEGRDFMVILSMPADPEQRRVPVKVVMAYDMPPGEGKLDRNLAFWRSALGREPAIAILADLDPVNPREMPGPGNVPVLYCGKHQAKRLFVQALKNGRALVNLETDEVLYRRGSSWDHIVANPLEFPEFRGNDNMEKFRTAKDAPDTMKAIRLFMRDDCVRIRDIAENLAADPVRMARINAVALHQRALRQVRWFLNVLSLLRTAFFEGQAVDIAACRALRVVLNSKFSFISAFRNF